MTGQPEPTISSIISTPAESDDLDSCFIIAGAFNLYLESLKRRANRTHLGPDDIQRVFTICRILLTAADLEQGIAKFIPQGRPMRAQ